MSWPTPCMRFAGIFVPLALVLGGCVGNPRERPPAVPATGAPPPNHLEIRGVPRSWSLAPHPAGGWLAATSHRGDFLGLWRLLPGRRAEPAGRQEAAGHHPDALHWVPGASGGYDLVVAAEGRQTLQRWRFSAGALSLADEFAPPAPPRDFAAADFDGDGCLDYVVSPYSGKTLYLLWCRGGFAFDVAELPAAPTPWHPLALDWDGDGRTDIAWSDWDTGSVRVALNRGGRRFETLILRPADPPGHSLAPRQVAAGDLDGDGRPDLVVPLETGKAALVLYNRGGTAKVREGRIPAPVWGYSFAALTRVQGRPLVALSEEGRIVLARPRGRGWVLRSLPAGSLPYDLRFQDLDGDGALDLAFANSAGDTLEIQYGPLWERATPLDLAAEGAQGAGR